MNFRKELNLVIRGLACDLINVDMTDPRNLGRVWQVRFGLWLLRKFPGPSCEELDKMGVTWYSKSS